MKPAAALLMAPLAAPLMANTLYVSDELILGVYTEQNNQGQRLTTLHSGAAVDALSVNGEYTEVRLADGTTGWVKSAYLMTREPASLRVKQLEEELNKTRATTPAQAEAAARNELEQMRRELKAKQAVVDAAVQSANANGTTSPNAASSSAAPASATEFETAARTPVQSTALRSPGLAAGAILAALACGFWLGYATLARRIKHKFGGLKIY